MTNRIQMNERSALNPMIEERSPRRFETHAALAPVWPLAVLAVISAPLAPVGAAFAQAVPDSGSFLQQIRPVKPPAPSQDTTGLAIQNDNGAKLPASEAFLVKTIEITGNTQLTAAVLHALVADSEGKSLNLTQLGELADRITEYYHAHGFPLARAIVPPQTIKDGVVQIQVLEARYGKVTLHNESRVRDSLLAATLAPLKSGDVIEETEMNHVLLLLSDVPKIAANAVIKPGDAVGTSDLDVTALPGPRFTGIASIDDYGNRYTGRTRGGATLSLIDPFAQGDYLSLAGLSSGEGLNYGRLSYEATVSGQGTRAGAAFSGLHYKLGDPLEALGGHGTAEVESLWGKQPVMRSQNVNLYAQIQFDRSTLHDDIAESGIKTDRHLDDFTGSLTGDERDAALSGGVGTWNLSVTAGRLGFDDVAAQIADQATARTIGGFSKWNLNVARLQKFSAATGLYFSYAGQWTSDNLDSSQKMIGGGPYTVRAYDLGAVSGDTGSLGTLELQRDLSQAWYGQWQATAFVDGEHLVVNKAAWTAGVNSATLTGGGLGLNWTGPQHWSGRTYLAARFGSVPTLVTNASSVRVWAEINKEF